MAWLVAPGNHVATLDTRKPSTVGSHPACTLVMKEELGIALQHYRIVPYGSDAAELHSLAPLGMEVMLNGQQVDNEPLPLSDRDTITTGDLKLIFRLTDPALDEIKPTALLEKKFQGETPTGQAAREIAASDAPVPVFQTPAPVAGESNLTPLALESLENVAPTGPGQLPEVSPFTPLEVPSTEPVVPTQAMDALPPAAPASLPQVQVEAAPLPVAPPAHSEVIAPQAAPVAEEIVAVPQAVVPPSLPQVQAEVAAPIPIPVDELPSFAVKDPAPEAILPSAPVAAVISEQAAEMPAQVNPIPVLPEATAPVAPSPVASPPALPVEPSQAVASEIAPPAAPVSAHPARPSELFLPKKNAPKLATDAGRRADAARRTSMRWGFRALGVVAAAAWILVAVYAFVDPARNVIHDLIGYSPLESGKIRQIEATIDAKNPIPGSVGEKTPASGVVGQE